MHASLAIALIAAVATLLAVFPPFLVPGFAYALGGALLLLVTGLIPPATVLAGIRHGADVYAFLAGMMLLAELCRQEAVFDWIAGHAARLAGTSATRLYTLVFLVGIVVTALLSNDATVVVLTPAVAAVARAVRMAEPLPLLFACVFVANAASFLLPISNPANLVLYGRHMPALSRWIPLYALPSLVALLSTYGLLRFFQRRALRAPLGTAHAPPHLALAGRIAAIGTLGAAGLMLVLSAMALPFGPATLGAGLATAVAVWACSARSPLVTLRQISWGVLPLVAGLFILVAAVDRTGSTARIASLLGGWTQAAPATTTALAGLLTALACNLANNLPVGLMAGQVLAAAPVAPGVRAATLIGVDLGPNLSIAGSLATILWLDALRRDGLRISAGHFFRLGLLVMPPALLLAILALFP